MSMGAISNLAFWTPSGWELLIILLVALILFGRRLPEVGRSLGRGLTEFKKGLRGVEDHIDLEKSPPQERPKEIESTARSAEEKTNVAAPGDQPSERPRP